MKGANYVVGAAHAHHVAAGGASGISHVSGVGDRCPRVCIGGRGGIAHRSHHPVPIIAGLLI